MSNADDLSNALQAQISMEEDLGFQQFMEAIEPVQEEEISQQIVKAMHARYKKPPVSELGACIGTPNLTPSDVCVYIS